MKGEESLEFTIAYQDLMEAFKTAQSISAVHNLTDTMKNVFVDGVLRIKGEVCKLAWDYYTVVEFEVDQQVIGIMRDVVETYLLKEG